VHVAGFHSSQPFSTAFSKRTFHLLIDADNSHAYSRFEGGLEGLDFHSRCDRDGCGK